jgi:RNA polymerase sigma-70 factor (ECF subfamily)
MGAAQEDSGTRVSLLGRLRHDPGDQEAWAQFVEHYGGRIYDWCLRWHLQDADAQDVTQTVLLKLAARLREFQYDPTRSFRAWLKTVTHHAWSDFVEANRRGRSSGDSVVLANLEARQDLEQRLQEQFDQELLGLAVARVRLRVAPQTWEAFHLTAVEGLSGAEAAARIPMAVAQVFVAKRRVQKLIQEELSKLEREGGPSHDAVPAEGRAGEAAGGAG